MTGVEGPRGGRGGGDSGCRRWRRGDRHRGQDGARPVLKMFFAAQVLSAVLDAKAKM